MGTATGDSIPTRPSLLNRLKSGDDPQSWREFYATYGRLIRAFALKAGLTEDEAEEVVQETAISVAKNLPGFAYDPKVCAFKTWLLNLTVWRIKNQFRRRHRQPAGQVTSGKNPRPDGSEETGRTSTIERVPDPAAPEFGAEWDAAYERSLLETAVERVRDQVEPMQFQIFDLYVLKQQSALDVARTLGINVARVYLAKYRLSALLKKEIRRMESNLA